MQITADLVKQLRDMTGAGMMECKRALASAGGDVDQAVDVLRKSGAAKAEKQAARAANEGRIDSYIHPGHRVGVLIEVNCETDFVARTPEFEELARNIAMQIAAADPEFVRRQDVPTERVAKEKEIIAAQLGDHGKPAAIVEKIVEGKLAKFFAEVCLMEQAYVRDDKKTVGDVVQDAAAKMGENIVVRRFSRFRLGQE